MSRWDAFWQTAQVIGLWSVICIVVLVIIVGVTAGVLWVTGVIRDKAEPEPDDQARMPTPLDPFTTNVATSYHELPVGDDPNGPTATIENNEYQVINEQTGWVGCAAGAAEMENFRRELARTWYRAERTNR